MIVGVEIIHPVARHAAVVLQFQGLIDVEIGTPRRVYSDEKLNIAAGINQHNTYDYIAITLNMSEENPGVMETRFGLPPNHDDETLVFYIEAPLQIAQFERPGRWTTYLEALYNTLVETRKKAQELNHKPIDDQYLFPEEVS